MSQDFREAAQRTLRIESAAVAGLMDTLDEQFEAACTLLLGCRGRVIVTGMGKSGHVGGKIAATLASTGTPAFFVHAAEASHGDLGMITADDVVLALSNSGETSEVLALLPVLKRKATPLVAMTGRPDSTLARMAEAHVRVLVDEEACPHNLAPTSSTTAALAMGDAMAIALLEARGFTAEDFALSHPGGNLGRRLLLRVEDIMHSGEQLPLVRQDTPVAEALVEVTGKGLGMTTVVNGEGRLTGIFTDGDLRRLLDHSGTDLRQTPIASVMTTTPVVIDEGHLAAEALQIMESRQINALVVVADGQPVGALNMHDLLRAGVV